MDVCTSGRPCGALLSSSGCEHFPKVLAVMCVHCMTLESVKPRHFDISAVIGVYCMISCLIHVLCAAVHDVIWIEMIEKSRGLCASLFHVYLCGKELSVRTRMCAHVCLCVCAHMRLKVSCAYAWVRAEMDVLASCKGDRNNWKWGLFSAVNIGTRLGMQPMHAPVHPFIAFLAV